jgi:hypothetical protein
LLHISKLLDSARERGFPTSPRNGLVSVEVESIDQTNKPSRSQVWKHANESARSAFVPLQLCSRQMPGIRERAVVGEFSRHQNQVPDAKYAKNKRNPFLKSAKVRLRDQACLQRTAVRTLQFLKRIYNDFKNRSSP